MEPETHPITSVLYSIATRCPVAIDDFTLGLHPDADLREGGELAMLDWTKPGGAIVADCIGVLDVFLARTSPIRALGAALAAAVKRDAELADELPLLSGLAIGADNLAEHTPGGPADMPLRMGLAARALALRHLGDAGDDLPELDSRGRELRCRKQPDYDRPAARWPIAGADFWYLDTIAHLTLTPADQALLAVVT